ncbi:MAG: hypothetical protein JNM72_20695 [Deltaproteobacteria bacterium]|nr:hypothetical protein [Deltaproteobacteria bacterium]
MTPDRFIDAFLAALSAGSRAGSLNVDAETSEWSEQVFGVLFDIAMTQNYIVCTEEDYGFPDRKSFKRGHWENEEFLWDMTWYDRKGDYVLPVAVIENENKPDVHELLTDLAKTWAAAAKLRIGIGYVEHADAVLKTLAQVNKVMAETADLFPGASSGVNDVLVLIVAHEPLVAHGFIRRAGSTQYVPYAAI